MTSGTGRVFIASILTAGLLLAGPSAHAPDSPRQPAILIAPELLAELPRIALMDCEAGASRQDMALRFERITADPDRDELRRLLSRGAQRAVAFEWDPDTGELAYGPVPALKPPATRGATASDRLQASCESR